MPATLVLAPRIVPLTPDASGVLRVTGTRIPLERVIECYQEGLTPEAIVEAFDSLRLADVYAILNYYPDYKDEVEAYLQMREKEAEAVRELIDGSQAARPGMRDQLLARQAHTNQKSTDAEAGH